LRTIYGLTTDGVRFYLFDRVAKPKVFKDGYRALIDAAPWDDGERANLVAEANEAFRLNRGVFDDLGKALGVGWSGSRER
ncbi:MAG TPA: biliverdin-producing heme oxygenase, partial [Pseudonocardiaceae bacterium]